jgi:uncharacterized protein YcbX
MKVAEIRRYPIKSLLGERPATADIDQRRLLGDRLWAIRDDDGKLGSGKNTRRFRRMPGLFSMRAHGGDRVPVVELPDGRRFGADDPEGHHAVSDLLGRRVTIEPEAQVAHHDEGPVSLISTGALKGLEELTGRAVDPLRFRANVLVDGFPDEDWLHHDIRIGDQVVLRPRRRLTRCVMIDMAQDGLPEHGRLLRTVADHHDLTFGIWATVERPGRISVRDTVDLLPPSRP